MSDYLDAVGVCFIALFAFALWPPLVLAVVGAAALLASWRLSQ